MLTLLEIEAFRGFLLSRRVTIKGNEHNGFCELLSILKREEAAALVSQRVRPVAVPTPPPDNQSAPEK